MDTQSFEELEQTVSVPTEAREVMELDVKDQMMGEMSEYARTMLPKDISELDLTEKVSTNVYLPEKTFHEKFRELKDEYPNLKKLTWHNLSNDELLMLLVGYKNPNLTILDISRDGYQESGLLILKENLDFVSENLMHLAIGNAIRMTDVKTVEAIARAHPHITHLGISGTGLTSVRPLRDLPLQLLNVSHNYLNDEDAIILSEQFSDDLQILDISHNELTNEGIRRAFIYTREGMEDLLNDHENVLDDADVEIPDDATWNVLRNLVETFIGPLEQVYKMEHSKTYQSLNVSNQKVHQIRPQLLEQLKMIQPVKVDDKDAKEREVKQQEQKEQQRNQLYIVNSSSMRLDQLVIDRPNLQFILFEKASNNRISFQSITELKHLQEIRIDELPIKNKTLKYVFKSKSIHTITIANSNEWNLSVANMIRNAKHLRTLTLINSTIPLEVILRILESRYITHLHMSGANLDFLTEANFDRTYQMIVDKILKNRALLEFTGYVKGRRKIDEHLKENRWRLEGLKQIVPLLLVMQPKGPLQTNDVLPVIYNFLGVQMQPELLTEFSHIIEPPLEEQATGKKRTRTKVEKMAPLPYMFQPGVFQK